MDFERKPKIIESIDFDGILASMTKNDSSIKGGHVVYHSQLAYPKLVKDLQLFAQSLKDETIKLTYQNLDLYRKEISRQLDKSTLKQTNLARDGKYKCIQEYRNILADNNGKSFSYSVPLQQENLENFSAF